MTVCLFWMIRILWQLEVIIECSSIFHHVFQTNKCSILPNKRKLFLVVLSRCIFAIESSMFTDHWDKLIVNPHSQWFNLSALVAQTLWVCAGIFNLVHDHVKKYDDASEDAFYQVEESIVPVDSSFGITWFLINSLKMFTSCSLAIVNWSLVSLADIHGIRASFWPG